MKKYSLKDNAYQFIKSRIVICEYLPNTFLNEVTISVELGMSRTPVREALNKLEQENLVRIYPKRGVMVTDITTTEVYEIFQVRLLLEPHIILNNAKSIEKRKLLDIKHKLERQVLSPSEEYYEIDQDIHTLIIASSNNRYFVALMENIYDQNHRLRILSGQKRESRLLETTREHILIIDCLLKGDEESAAESMRTHLENSKIAALDGLLAL